MMSIHINYFSISTCIGSETLSLAHHGFWRVTLSVPLSLGLVWRHCEGAVLILSQKPCLPKYHLITQD